MPARDLLHSPPSEFFGVRTHRLDVRTQGSTVYRLRARRCEPRSVVPKLVRVTVWREGGCCVTFDGGAADVSCASSDCAGVRHGVARRWLLRYLRRRRLMGAALASTLACVMVWREGGCCATFDGGGSTVAVLADAGCAGLLLYFCGLRWPFTLACVVPAGRLTAKPAATCTLVLRPVTFCSAACTTSTIRARAWRP